MDFNIDTRKVGIIDANGNAQPFPIADAIQLEDVSNSTSITKAPTSNQIKLINDKLNNHINDADNHITSIERTTWNSKADRVQIGTLNNLNTDDKTSLVNAINEVKSISEEVTPWTSISGKPTSISEFGISDAYTKTQIDTILSAKSDAAHTHSNATITLNGFMSASDKVKLDGIATGATIYTHPQNHPPSIIVQDPDNRFVTDSQIITWNNKADASHTHRISDITDIDVTSKSDGDTLVYDSTSGKYISQPIVTNVGVSSPTAYYVELTKWGIVQGLPSKPYSVVDYNNANNNISGINNALQYAFTNNYNEVVFPRGDYAICYPNSIKTQPNMTINFNFSTLKVLYDSDVRSPLDTSTNAINSFGGVSILCTTPYTHIVNLNLVGDRIDRSWSNLSQERTRENTTGIQFGAGSNNSSVKNCTISYYMGDAIYLSFGPYSSFNIGSMEFGDINTSGQIITSTNPNIIRSSNYISLPIGGLSSFTMIGLGYAPMTNIPSKTYNVYFYKNDNTFINSKQSVRTRDKVPVPKNASKIKLVWEGNGTLDGGASPSPAYWALLLKEGISDNVLIEYNEFHRNHRGCIFLGTNNVMIRKNYFHDTGDKNDVDIDGIPTFSDFTRYAINTEDNVGQNCKIIDNIFDNVRMAVALRGEFNEVSGNEYRNCIYGIMLYNLKHCTVNKNFFYKSDFGCYGYDNIDKGWIITNNIFNGSSLNISGNNGSVANITNNSFIDSRFSSTPPVLNFENNTFNNSIFTVLNILTKINNCSFINNSLINVISINAVFDGIIKCNFVNSYIRGQNSNQIIVRDSSFTNSRFEYSTGKMTYTYINCDINNNNTQVISSNSWNGIGPISHNLEIKNSRISIASNLIYSMNWGDLLIDNSIINYNISANLTSALLAGWGNIKGTVQINQTTISSLTASASHILDSANEIIITAETFTNFSITNPPHIPRRSDKSNTIPISGKYKLGQQVMNTLQVSIGFIGWICTTAGTANNVSWTANTLYSLNTQVNASGKVYRCTVAGASGNNPPSHTTGTSIDGTVTWLYIDNLAVLKQFGLISG